MGRTGSTVPGVHTSPQKFMTCNGLEVLFLQLRHSKDLYWVPGPPLYYRIGGLGTGGHLRNFPIPDDTSLSMCIHPLWTFRQPDQDSKTPCSIATKAGPTTRRLRHWTGVAAPAAQYNYKTVLPTFRGSYNIALRGRTGWRGARCGNLHKLCQLFLVLNLGLGIICLF